MQILETITIHFSRHLSIAVQNLKTDMLVKNYNNFEQFRILIILKWRKFECKSIYYTKNQIFI